MRYVCCMLILHSYVFTVVCYCFMEYCLSCVFFLLFIIFFFFFKQKTAYEMRISDWSSDVCSSDLRGGTPGRRPGGGAARGGTAARLARALRAPVDGIVHDLKVHTVGGVVQAAEPVMRLVPTGGPLEVEAKILNRDLGFVHEGPAVQVQPETLGLTPPTRTPEG